MLRPGAYGAVAVPAGKTSVPGPVVITGAGTPVPTPCGISPCWVALGVGIGAGELAGIVVAVGGTVLPVSQPATAEAASTESAAARKNRLVRGKFNLEMLLSGSVHRGQEGR
jgi:hypothetical protein